VKRKAKEGTRSMGSDLI